MNRQQYIKHIMQEIEKDFELDYSKKETKELLIEQKKREFENDFKTDEELEELKDNFFSRLSNG